MPIRALSGATRQWMLNHISIRLRLAIWYGLLLSVTLTLFSLTVFAVAQNQLQTSVDESLRGQAASIANTLQDQQLKSGVVTSATPTATAKSQPTATPSRATPTPTAGASATPTTVTTPVPTPNPATQQEIQAQLTLKVPEVLGHLDLGFEVLNAKGEATYRAPNILRTGLPHDDAVIAAALHEGVCGTYTQRQQHPESLLRIFVQPVTLPVSGTTRAGVSSTTTDCHTALPNRYIIGAVIVAKPIDDVVSSLDTLSRLLVIGVLAAVAFTTFGGLLIAGNGLQPITRMTRTARAIAVNAHAAGLGRRVGYRGPRDEVGELASTFDDMLGSIERVTNAQRRFIADASHELRAPLTTIKGSLEFLRRAPDLPESERADVLEDAYTEADRMAALVNDLLLLARADAAVGSEPGPPAASIDDHMRGRRETVELDQLALDIFRHGRAQLLARHRAQLQLTIESLEPEAVLADPGQLRQVLLILLDNAIKYTPSGGKVSISVNRQGGKAALSISDTGIGIEPEVQPHIFERFYRGDQARARDQHGSGLGLAIAKWIVAAHNGELTVTSEPGKGSVFTVLLPAMRRPGEQTSAKVPAVRRVRSRLSVAGAIQPLARLARVSRPTDAPLSPSRYGRDGKASHDGRLGRHSSSPPKLPPRPPRHGKADE
ncbi:MAG TPA: HAMP domain-containing sensor histidine kinase [Ktedonobacterales bacterium]|nr:HAMP domain-containing sensor histidine kinase [Ktedonobacterales bacterium]